MDTTYADGGTFRQLIGDIWSGGVLIEMAPDGGAIVICDRREDQMNRPFAMKLRADGTPDPGFGPLGDGSTGTLPDMTFVQQLVVLPDGTFLLVGMMNDSYPAVCHFHADGSRDMSFGMNGEVHTTLPGGLMPDAAELHLLPDGKLLLTGLASNPNNLYPLPVIYTARFTSDGIVDGSYGLNGARSFDQHRNDTLNLHPSNSIVGEDGVVYLVGPADVLVDAQAYLYYCAITRVGANGQLDTTFGGGRGYVLYANGHTTETAVMYASGRDLVRRPDGKLLFFQNYLDSQNWVNECELICFNPDGSMDLAFGDSGRMFFHGPGGGQAGKLAFQPDGKLLACGAWLDEYVHTQGFGCVRFGGDDSAAIPFANVPEAASLSIYPNPAHDHITLKYILDTKGPVHPSLLDAQGRVCQWWTPLTSSSMSYHQVSLELSSTIEPGLYFIELTSDGRRSVAKVRVE